MCSWYKRCQGCMKRRGHATTIYRNPNGRGFMSKNSKEFIARALYALRLASVLGRFFSNWSYFPGGRLAKYSISCWLISIMTHTQYTLRVACPLLFIRPWRCYVQPYAWRRCHWDNDVHTLPEQTLLCGPHSCSFNGCHQMCWASTYGEWMGTQSTAYMEAETQSSSCTCKPVYQLSGND